jgi:hypothetical protein
MLTVYKKPKVSPKGEKPNGISQLPAENGQLNGKPWAKELKS